ncbi:MAG TPA: class I SAM-dependent methyltransferase [Conexibacter sp.]|nr:class I SAM-dependent methyltransferase [Conexibacter sp.]
MSPVDAVLSRLQEPRLAGLDVDTSDMLEVHRQVLAEKPIMRAVFAEFYDRCMEIDREHGSGDGQRIEIGAGSSLFSERYPEVVATDIKPHPHLDRVLDAQAMDLEPASARAIFGINCFHHLPDPMAFFGELDRVLVPGGTCVLIEPYHGPVAGAFYARLFETEGFDRTQQTWEDSDRSIMHGANQALSYIVFERDRALFDQRCPRLEVVVEEPLANWPRYLLSGGLNFRQLVPSRSGARLRQVERLLAPTRRWLALHHVVALRKRVAPTPSVS